MSFRFSNPATTTLQINYEINQCESATIGFIPFYGAVGKERIYKLGVLDNKIVIDVAAWDKGLYKLLLYCDGDAVEMRSVLIE